MWVGGTGMEKTSRRNSKRSRGVLFEVVCVKQASDGLSLLLPQLQWLPTTTCCTSHLVLRDIGHQVCILLREQQQALRCGCVCVATLPELLQHMLPPLLVACH